MTAPLVIVGCGGFGREVHDVIDAINDVEPTWELLGYLDDTPDATNVKLVESRGFRVLGGTDWPVGGNPEVQFVIGIGTGSVRRAIDRKLTAAGFGSAALVHPAATLGYDVRVGAGTVICAGVRVTTNISLGRHVHLNINTTVGHDCTLADYVTVNPLVAISGGVSIGSESMLGTNSAVLQQLSIGDRSVVGAGSCVVRDVPDDTVVKGVPAK
jgi:sugar O-acyltransferase (sialic acid O-acetyltransferase NeuD family)